MPMRNAALTNRHATSEGRAQLKALRRAVQIGIDDLEAGRYKEFASFADLEVYLREKADRVLAKSRASGKRR